MFATCRTSWLQRNKSLKHMIKFMGGVGRKDSYIKSLMLHFLEHHINSLLKLNSHNYLFPSFVEVKFQGRNMRTATRATSKSVMHRP